MESTATTSFRRPPARLPATFVNEVTEIHVSSQKLVVALVSSPFVSGKNSFDSSIPLGVAAFNDRMMSTRPIRRALGSFMGRRHWTTMGDHARRFSIFPSSNTRNLRQARLPFAVLLRLTPTSAPPLPLACGTRHSHPVPWNADHVLFPVSPRRQLLVDSLVPSQTELAASG